MITYGITEMNKIRYILDMTNIRPDGSVRARLSSAFFSATSRQTSKKRRVAAAVSAAAAVVLIVCVIAAVGVYRSARSGRKNPFTPSPVTNSGGSNVNENTLVLDCQIEPMYSDNVYYEEFRQTVIYSRMLSDGVAAVNKDGIKKLADRYKAPGDDALDGIVMTLYAGSEYGEHVIIENVHELEEGETEPLKYYSEGFEPVILAASRSGSFEYLLVLDLKRSSDGYVYTRTGRVGQYKNGTYQFDGDALRSGSADLYKIRFELGSIVIYERTEVSLGTAFLNTGSGFTYGTAGDRFLSGEENDMRSDMCPSGTVPDDFPYTFSIYNTDASALFSSDTAYGMTVSRREICDIINSLSLQWFVPLHRFESGDVRTYIGIGITMFDMTISSMLSSTSYPVYGNGNFVIEGERESYSVNLYYSPWSSDRPCFNESFSDSVEYLLVVEEHGGEMRMKTTHFKEACRLIENNGGAIVPEGEATLLPVIREESAAGFEPFSVDRLCFCKNAGALTETPCLFDRLGMSVNIPAPYPDSVLFRVQYLPASLISSDGGELIRHYGTDYNIRNVTGYVRAGKFTVSCDGYLNGVIGDNVTHCNLCPPYGFSVMTDREGHVMQICRTMPKETDLTGYYTSDLFDGMYAGEMKQLLYSETLDAAVAFVSNDVPDTATVEVLLSSDTGYGLFTYYGYLYRDDYGDTYLKSDAGTVVSVSDNAQKRHAYITIGGVYHE